MKAPVMHDEDAQDWADDMLRHPSPFDVAELMALRDFFACWVRYHTAPKKLREEIGKELLAYAHELDRMKNPPMIVRPQ